MPRLFGLTDRATGTRLLAASPARLFTLTIGTTVLGADQATTGTLRLDPHGVTRGAWQDSADLHEAWAVTRAAR